MMGGHHSVALYIHYKIYACDGGVIWYEPLVRYGGICDSYVACDSYLVRCDGYVIVARCGCCCDSHVVRCGYYVIVMW